MARAVLLVSLLVSACAPARAAPPAMDAAESLRQALLARDRAFLARDPELVAAKYTRMARTKFSFFRATAWRAIEAPSRFAAEVAVIGDPHPENVGTFLDSREVRAVEFNDFDLAGYGSYVDDLRRLAVGFWVVADMADLKHKQRLKVVDELVTGYLGEVRALGAGKPAVALRADTLSGDLEEILAAPDIEAKDLPASAEETALARKILEAYPKTLVRPVKGGFTLKSLARRQGGVSSYPVLRLHAVVEGPTAAPNDDWTLELKESVGAPAAQLVSIQRQFQERPDVDPLLGWAAAGGREFRVRQFLPGQRRLDAERLARQVKSPRWGKGDLKDLAHAIGRLLARGHARAEGRDGKPGLARLEKALGDGLREETAAYAEKQAAVNTEEFHLFQQLRDKHGPLLGWKK